MDKVDIEQVGEYPVWILRLNGDGRTFQAVCCSWLAGPNEIFIAAGMSKVHGGLVKMVTLAQPFFKSKGASKLRYIHNGREVTHQI